MPTNAVTLCEDGCPSGSLQEAISMRPANVALLVPGQTGDKSPRDDNCCGLQVNRTQIITAIGNIWNHDTVNNNSEDQFYKIHSKTKICKEKRALNMLNHFKRCTFLLPTFQTLDN
ncbi:hypothetical protein TNIN_146971 [Trichonephila inaurata madagascariensis]|uniref:Uncharacterized protein n=1 Tax=Trichonephila inaurata madagascariensis TaxID=2747483 RepID=A0A8X6XZN7_9ARAC|nr:hypothetical protein TNIN_146971 [Trichonephila inaurata madagascariensis]